MLMISSVPGAADARECAACLEQLMLRMRGVPGAADAHDVQCPVQQMPLMCVGFAPSPSILVQLMLMMPTGPYALRIPGPSLAQLMLAHLGAAECS